MNAFVSFPSGVLRPASVKLPVLALTEELLCVGKPAGFPVTSEDRDGERRSLADALQAAIQSGKQQLVDLGIDYAGPVFNLDAETTGVGVFARSRNAEIFLRNALGSSQLAFSFDLVGRTQGQVEVRACELPLARHSDGSRAVVSRETGKKSRTTFHPLRRFGNFVLWEARTVQLRHHQVRIHAAESGIGIPGEAVYGRVREIYLSELKPDYRRRGREERALHSPLCLHLRQVTLPLPDGTRLVVEVERPRSFRALIRNLESFGRSGPVSD